MTKYRKKPVVVDAYQWNDGNKEELPEWLIKALDDGTVYFDAIREGVFWVNTLEGNLMFGNGDFIIKGVAGEIYSCKPDIFEKTYEVAK